jgi:hypothetical protein
MRPQKTFPAIARLLADGCWHAIDDLGNVTTWPEEWVNELPAEGCSRPATRPETCSCG